MLFTFPSRYLFAIGHARVLRLGGWSPHVQTGFHVPRLTQVHLSDFRIRGCHPLWRSFPEASANATNGTGLVPVRSPLLRESLLMSFPPGTEMFQFSGFASPKPILFSLVIPYPPLAHAGKPASTRNGEGGFPHSEIAGSKPAHGSPTLIAACHVLLRLCMPRHPPNALTSRLRVRTTNGSPASPDPEGSRQTMLRIMVRHI